MQTVIHQISYTTGSGSYDEQINQTHPGQTGWTDSHDHLEI